MGDWRPRLARRFELGAGDVVLGCSYLAVSLYGESA